MVKTNCISICCVSLECQRNRRNFDKYEDFRRDVTFALLDRIQALVFSRTNVPIL
jgi:hypothetical protein